jgi:RimJ/RimL family protein N-acetyltransferase
MPAYPRRTARLTLRLMRSSDAEAHTAYRNDPEVAKHQLWELPYPVEKAVASFAEQDDRDDIVPGEWTTLAVELDGTLIGDVVTNVDPTGGVAEIGFTLARRFQGHGYATEAASTLVEDLVERVGVGRVYGELDPVNVASQRVLENAGLVFEAVTRRSFLWRGEWTDNMHYGATAEEYRAWRDRPTAPPDVVRLVPVTEDNYRAYGALATHHSQQRFVAPMLQSYADALFPEVVDGAPVVPRLRGIEADGEPAGFLMLAEATPAHAEPFLWRLLVDRMHQGRGIGRTALGLLVAGLRDEGHRSLMTSWQEGPGGPQPFYSGLGFTGTGERHDGEVVARLDLGAHRA